MKFLIAKIIFIILAFVFIGHQLFIIYSETHYAECQRLTQDWIPFKYYRNTEREVYQEIYYILSDEMTRLNCGINIELE